MAKTANGKKEAEVANVEFLGTPTGGVWIQLTLRDPDDTKKTWKQRMSPVVWSKNDEALIELRDWINERLAAQAKPEKLGKPKKK